ncbi:MAG: cytochrome c peroxidase [Ignavibacteriaceae bacterium]
MNKIVTFLALGIFLVFSSLIHPQDLTPIQQLGKKIFFDKISSPDWMSCANCHSPAVGFVGPNPGTNKKGAVYNGAIPQRFGNRKPPSSTYATYSPNFDYDASEDLFFGGNFWDGRATGWNLGNPAADQALGPFLNPVEQNNPDKRHVLMQIADSKYAGLWEDVWGEPITYNTPAEINANYNRVGLSIAAYEASEDVSPFTSKFDYYLKGMVDLTPQEMMGMQIFNNEDDGGGKCSLCHISASGPNNEPPLFTDFTFDNLGAPKNPDNPFYDMDKVFLDDGTPINPLGDAWIDYGLGDFLRNLADPSNQGWRTAPFVTTALSGMSNADLLIQASANDGKQKVPTLRNVDKKNGNNFTKAYLHNGVFKSLKEVVHFYNTRDVETWPSPEVPENVNTEELGNLGLSDNEEDAIVAFLKTLSDGFRIDKVKKEGNALTYSEKPSELKIKGPNPFNPSTRLGYYIPEDGNIQLSVFNITGEKVVTLQNGFMTAGEHQVEFNADNLSSGIYFVSLITGREVKTVKLILLK